MVSGIYRIFWSFCCLTILHGQAFIDVTTMSGTDYFYPDEGWWGAGATMVDLNHDGNLDILLPTFTGDPIKILNNNGDGTFTDITYITEVFDNEESKNILVADYDNDGDDDMFIVNYFSTSRLYQNDGDDTFTEVTESAGMTTASLSSRVACWLDIDNDSWLDLYVLNRELLDNNILYHNNGDGTFSDITESAGVVAPFEAGLVIATLDYNNDGWLDIYVGNDKDTGNILYHNNGDMTFTDVSMETGTDLVFSTMGLAVADYDGNGYLDIYVTNLDEGNALLKNNGDNTFTEVATDLGIQVNKVCWGTVFTDYDNDGWVDLHVATGCDWGLGMCNPDWPGYNPGIDNRDMLYQNQGNGSFIDVSESSGLDDNYMNYGSTMGDFDNDGFVDIYILSEGITSRLYKNMGSFTSTNNWIQLKLTGTESNRNGIGARVEVVADGHTQVQEVRCGSSYCGQNSFILNFGIGVSPNIDTIRVRWPSGIGDEFYNITSNQAVDIIEGTGENDLVIEDTSIEMHDFKLISCYPNPVNSNINIIYELNKPQAIAMEIIDILGKKVYSRSKFHTISGQHTIHLDGSTLQTGIYFVQLSGEFGNSEQKITVLK